MDLWKQKFEDFIVDQCGKDLAHDIHHVKRVVRNAMAFCEREKADSMVVFPAAWLHDCVIVSKGSSQRSLASKLAADKAIEFLKENNYPQKYWDNIHHSIVAHSYSANITPETLEAKIVQDADRIDALGAIGIARCIIVGAELKRQLYSQEDPFCKKRAPKDDTYTIDHFYEKVLHIGDRLHTSAAKEEAKKRKNFVIQYLQHLEDEISFCEE